VFDVHTHLLVHL